MAVTLTGTGGIFKRLGRIAGGLADVVAIKGGTATARTLSGANWTTRATDMESDAAESPAVSKIYEGQYAAVGAWQSAQTSLFQYLKALSENTVIEQVNLDASLSTRDTTTALTELIRQMRATSDSVNASTVAAGSQTSVGTPTGNTIIVTSTKNTRGDVLQCIFAEKIRFATSVDYQSGATARQETISVKGQPAVSDAFSHLWPGGSGGSVSLAVTNAQADNSGNNKLYNGDFETFTSNYPEDWVIATGTAGTDVLAAGSSDAYTLINALKLTGQASPVLSCIRQTFNQAHSTTSAAGGTPYAMLASRQYACNLFVKAITGAPAAGVLRVRLVDGSNAVISDDAGTANSFTVTLTGITTSFVAYNGTFRMPSVLPSTVKLEIALTTAITSGSSVVIDDVALCEMTSLYNGGLSVAAFAGSTNTYIGDVWTVTTTNTMGVLAMWMERVFGMRDRGLQFPYSGSPTVADSVVA